MISKAKVHRSFFFIIHLLSTPAEGRLWQFLRLMFFFATIKSGIEIGATLE